MSEKNLFDNDGYWIETLKKLHAEGKLRPIAIDECHKIVEWGETEFRSSYARLGELRDALPVLQTGVEHTAWDPAPPPRWPLLHGRAALSLL